jgi:hypothetical protein
MHVPLTAAMLKLDASSPRRTARDLMHVTPEAVMQPPENASTPKFLATTTTHVPPTLATRIPENANMSPRAAMTTTHVPPILVTEIPDCAQTLQRPVTTTTHVQETHATPKPENASLKTSLLQSSLHALTNVSLQLATHSRDSSKLHLNAQLVTSALNLTAIHPEDA